MIILLFSVHLKLFTRKRTARAKVELAPYQKLLPKQRRSKTLVKIPLIQVKWNILWTLELNLFHSLLKQKTLNSLAFIEDLNVKTKSRLFLVLKNNWTNDLQKRREHEGECFFLCSSFALLPELQLAKLNFTHQQTTPLLKFLKQRRGIMTLWIVFH